MNPGGFRVVCKSLVDKLSPEVSKWACCIQHCPLNLSQLRPIHGKDACAPVRVVQGWCAFIGIRLSYTSCGLSSPRSRLDSLFWSIITPAEELKIVHRAFWKFALCEGSATTRFRRRTRFRTQISFPISAAIYRFPDFS